MIKKLPIEALRPGMSIVKLSSDVWEHMPNLYTQPGIIRSGDEVRQIKERGFEHAFVEVEVPGELSLEKGLDAILAQCDHAGPAKFRVPFEQEIEAAFMAYENAMLHVRRIVSDVKLGRAVDYDASMATIDSIVETAVRNPNTLVCLSKLSRYDDYTYTHCINVAAISVVFGEFLGLGKKQLQLLGVAGMMHDLGKIAVPENIINKRARLNEAEFDQIRHHPQYGCDILGKQLSIPGEIIDAVRDHHEKYNGSGYPNGLKSNETSPMGRIISLADVYDALTSDRAYKDAILPNRALALMYGMREQDFDPLEVQIFIKSLGIFPAGSLVRLNTGFHALVYESNPMHPLLPKVKIILDKDLRPIQSETVDLATQWHAGKDGLEIVECVDPGAYRLNLKPFLRKRR
ncbi:HD-GYP domain-containing protein [Pseudodesulfovibrio piezophilus]|uniref:Metal dependent phosphohydrolase n=1 Tax=Pseudodesulfovibrio piezophilus (strain DSM 21447 / JCM 15486 / C1TLV30) TaxID=1322246 RepID=M1WSY3_PSEP2|nr:HD-GYP domain-containing protein [Pseudodesulfovibrio piezophilus]CCH49177.1 Metal dependent phosphohydrolase [Pseudodesulfovibrio piezophilus C1TLV30]